MGSAIIFLAYLSRSGSTYLCSLLDRHPEIVVTPEAQLPQSVAGPAVGRGRIASPEELEVYLDFLFDDYKFRSWGLAREEIRAELLRRGAPPLPTSRVLPALLALYAARQGKAARVVVFKEGRRALLFHEAVLAVFPGAGLLHLIRDPRAVYASQRRTRRSQYPVPFTLSPGVFGREWAGDLERAAALEGRPEYLRVRYEDLVRDVEGVLGRILGWLGCAPEPLAPEGELEYAERIPVEQRHLHDRLQSRPDPARLDAWRQKLSAGEQRRLVVAAWPALEGAGYGDGHGRPEGAGGRPGLPDRLKQALLLKAVQAIKLGRLLRSPARLGRFVRARRLAW